MKKFKVSPYFLIMLSFAAVILLGALLLWLPFSTKSDLSGLSFIDALFIATTSISGTGLSVVANPGMTFSVFGKIVIIILMEIGGLSFLTLASFFVLILGKRLKVGMSARHVLKESLGQDNVKGTLSLIRDIVITALIIQAFGVVSIFIILTFTEHDLYTFGERLLISIFHCESAFCTVGLDIFGNEKYLFGSMLGFRDNVLLKVITMILVILGEFGTVQIIDVYKARKWKRFKLTTKIVIIMIGTLIAVGSILIWVLMNFGGGEAVSYFDALFLTVSMQGTTGFTVFDASLDPTIMPNSMITIGIILMAVGTAPCSTGGGIKCTTFFVLLAFLTSFITGKEAKAFGRRISKSTMYKAISLFFLFIIMLLSMCFLLSIAQPTYSIKESVFLIVSAFSTAGISFGEIPFLTTFGKIVIITTMFIGRVGLLTLVNILNTREINFKENYAYIEENVLIG